ncbi:MAG: tRNA glutamyl-Q(34) synthetase GluQRS [Pseudomonadota bacterium]
MIRERFAPSPTGLLHLGHAYSALIAHDAACAAGGTFLLRIEDIDGLRSTTRFESQLFDDLKWLGLDWPEPVLRQSQRTNAYQSALDLLVKSGLLFPCSCTRKDIQSALSAPHEDDTALHLYPGTCRNREMADWKPGDAIRLNMSKAIKTVGTVSYIEIGTGVSQTIGTSAQEMIDQFGDVVLARKDIQTSYHLSVVVDDAFQSITHVTRGRDIAPLTPIHVLLQKILNLPSPIYRHHKLIRDENGKRLAKRHDAMSLKAFRDTGQSPLDIRASLGL